MSIYYVYILQSLKTGKLYIGQTNNLTRRMEDYNNGYGKYTCQNGPWVLLHHETYTDRTSAMKREQYLKSCRGSYEKKKLAGILK